MTSPPITALPALSRRRRHTVLAVCALSMFLVGLDTTIVNVGLPEIGRSLAVSTRDLAWVVDAYTVVLAGLLITSGALADRFGRRRVFRTGLVVFGVASLACAVAPTLGALVAARAVQGIGASMLSPVALAIVVNATPDPRERARAIGVWASVFGLSMAVGPVAGGALLGTFEWRSVFWINVPIVLAALVLVAVFVPESRGQRTRHIDVAGQVLLGVLLGVTIGLLIEGPRLGWASPVVLCGYAVGVAAGIGFWLVESRQPEPLIDPALFRRPSFTGAVIGAGAVFVALSTTLLLTTLYLQQARAWTPFEAGAASLPMALGATVCAPLSGMLVGRLGARVPLLLAGGFLVLGGLLLLPLGTDSGVLSLLLAYLLVGIGVGFANAPITNTAVNGLSADRAGVAGGTTSSARQLGSAIGIAVAAGLAAEVDPAGLAAAIRPGWLLVALCGVILLLVARTAPRGSAGGRPMSTGVLAAGR